MKGVILAAGVGRRLKASLTESIPKALIPIRLRPMIGYVIENFKKCGIKDLGIVIRPEEEAKFLEALRNLKLNINYIFQDAPKGSADALKEAEGFIKNERFLLAWCDFISPFEPRKIIEEHLKFRPQATILINREKDPSGTAQVLFEGPYITKIVEKPEKTFSVWGSAGMMVLEPEIFSVLDKIVPRLPEGEYHIATALQYWINQGRKVRFVRLDTWRVNVNTAEDIRRVEKLISASNPYTEDDRN